jgi:hypothetical protein
MRKAGLKIMFCTNCGSKIEGMKFCASCGAALQSESSPSQDAQDPSAAQALAAAASAAQMIRQKQHAEYVARVLLEREVAKAVETARLQAPAAASKVASGYSSTAAWLGIFVGALILVIAIVMTNINQQSTPSEAPAAPVNPAPIAKSEAYLAGYANNLGLSPYTKSNMPSAEEYCRTMQEAMYSELTGQAITDYRSGCVDAWNSGQ